MNGNHARPTATPHHQNGAGRLSSEAMETLSSSAVTAPSTDSDASPEGGAVPNELATTTIRTQVRRILADDQVSQKTAAKEMGLNAAALNQWLQGDGIYQGSETNVVKAVTQWLRSRGERVEMQALLPRVPKYFESETAKKIMSGLRLAHTTGEMVSVLGVPGIGKSTTCEEYRRQYPNVWIATLASSITTAVPVLQEIAEAMGARGNSSRVLLKAIIAKVRGTAGLLIIDEAHHASPHALDTMRALHDATGIGIAFVGGVELDVKVQQMPQFFSRLGLRLYTTQLQRADAKTLASAWGIVDAAQVLFLTKLAEQRGALRGATKTLRLAAMLAHNEGESLALKHLEIASQMRASQTAFEEA